MKKTIHVLLVDDDEDEYVLTQNLLSDRLQPGGLAGPVRFHLDWRSNFPDGLSEMKRQTHDAYLVDYQLGEHNGLELVQAARADGCSGPMILLTGQGNYQLDLEAMQAGATDYLVKGEVTAALLERSIRYAIENKRAEEKIRRNAERAELLAALSHTFAQAGLDFDEVLDTIARRVAESTGDACVIHLLSEDHNILDEAASHHSDLDLSGMLKDLQGYKRLDPHKGPEGEALHTGQTQTINKAQAGGSALGEINRDGQYYSQAIAPLRIKDRPIGTLRIIRSLTKAPYNREDELFLQDLADRAALAIENARLYQAEAQRARELDALQRATAALLTTIDLDTLLSRILDIAESALPGADQALLHLAMTANGEPQIGEAYSIQDLRIRKIQFPISESCSAETLLNGLPILLTDLHHPPDLSGTCFAEIGLPTGLEEAGSVVIAPLSLGGELLGLLSLAAAAPDAFEEADMWLLMSFANTTTAALNNAMLHAKVQRLAVTDSLTEVYNRRGFFNLGRREIERALRFGHTLSTILIDLDGFKEINDLFGHPVGDQVLRIIAERLKKSVREVDILGRYGGDEFVVLLPETEVAAALAAAERIRVHLAEPIAIKGSLLTPAAPLTAVNITASLGIANLDSDLQDLPSLLARADAAAYSAKTRGRNRIEIG
jgi:diguanylate cyclase (GGDEF)-like protein